MWIQHLKMLMIFSKNQDFFVFLLFFSNIFSFCMLLWSRFLTFFNIFFQNMHVLPRSKNDDFGAKNGHFWEWHLQLAGGEISRLSPPANCKCHSQKNVFFWYFDYTNRHFSCPETVFLHLRRYDDIKKVHFFFYFSTFFYVWPTFERIWCFELQFIQKIQKSDFFRVFLKA